LVDVPELNEVNSVEVGDTIVSKGKIYEYDGIVLNKALSRGDGVLLAKVTVPAGTLIARNEDSKFTYYESDSIAIQYQPDPIGGICIAKKDPNEMYIYVATPLFERYTIKRFPQIEHTKVVDYENPSFEQELIYNGKTNNSVKFLYRELKNNLMRDSFSQEVQYDLKDGAVIGFKGVRIEIVEATNLHLKYRVLKSFPDTL